MNSKVLSVFYFSAILFVATCTGCYLFSFASAIYVHVHHIEMTLDKVVVNNCNGKSLTGGHKILLRLLLSTWVAG